MILGFLNKNQRKISKIKENEPFFILFTQLRFVPFGDNNIPKNYSVELSRKIYFVIRNKLLFFNYCNN